MKHYAYPEDIDRIRAAAWAHGLHLSRKETNRIWRNYSDNACAAWLSPCVHEGKLWQEIQTAIREWEHRLTEGA